MWGAISGAFSSLIGGALQGNQANKAAKAGADAARAAAEESARQYDLNRSDMMPWLDAGRWALEQQQNLLKDPSQIVNNPQYQWMLDQGFKGLDRGAARGGNLWGGGADADRIELGQGLAGQQLNNMLNNYASLSGAGQNTAGQLGQMGANYASQQQGNLFAGANARASGYANQANIWGNALGQMSNLFGQRFGNSGGGSSSGSINNFGNNLGNFIG